MLGRDGLRLHTELYPCQVSPHLELLLGAKLLVDHAGSLIKQRRRNQPPLQQVCLGFVSVLFYFEFSETPVPLTSHWDKAHRVD